MDKCASIANAVYNAWGVRILDGITHGKLFPRLPVR